MISDAKNAIKSLIVANKASLMSGLDRQGKERVIYHVTTSRGTPPRSYYYISVHARPIRRQVKLAVANDELDFLKTVYAIEVTVIDYLLPETGEDQPYESDTEDADTLIDRLVDLFENMGNITSGSSRFRLSDPFSIEADPAIVNWEEAEAYHHVYVCDITFELEKC